MTTLQERTDEIVRRESARFNYNGNVQVSETSGKPCFTGKINLTTSRMELGYNPVYEQEAEQLEGIVEEPFEKAFTSLTTHELEHNGGGNFRGCPRDINLHIGSVLEPVSETFRNLGFPNVPVSQDQTLYQYFANLFEDVIDNSEIGNKREHIGMFLTYKDDAEHLESRQFSLLFEAFVKLQEIFYGGKRSRRLLSPHYQGGEEVETAINNFLERTELSNLKRKKLTRRKKQEVELFDRKEALKYCLDERNWPELSSILTEEFAKLLDKNRLQQPEYLAATFIPLRGEDSFSDEVGDSDIRMRFAWANYKEQGEAFQPPAFLENFEALDLVYQKLARDLEIKTRASTRATSMPVMHYGRRRFDPKKDRLSKARVRIGKEGKLELSVKPYQVDYPVEYESRRQNIPGIRFVQLDTSDSMRLPVETGKGKTMNPWVDEEMQWTDNSRYHHGLIAWYGLLELLRKQGTLRHKSVRFVNYSDSTKTAANLRDSKRLALTPQFGGTELDIDSVGSLLGRNELVLSVSDGAIDNWSSIKDKYIELARGNEYIHFQIGNFSTDETGSVIGKPQMCADLENAGLPVYYDDGRNLGKLVVDLTRPYITRN